MGFFVYLVESPSAVDFYHDRSEGGLVSQAISLDSIPCFTRTAINPETFIAALSIGLPEAMKIFPDKVPILHISAHGSKTGIQLSDGREIIWARLRELIVPINEGLSGNLLLCMSACEGYHACQMAMSVGNDPHPYLAMVGNFGSPTWSDTAAAYAAFYHNLAKGRGIQGAVDAMKAASVDTRWVVETANNLKQGFIEYMQQIEPAQAIAELEGNTEAREMSRGAKAWFDAFAGTHTTTASPTRQTPPFSPPS